jgi:hypothetical protein
LECEEERKVREGTGGEERNVTPQHKFLVAPLQIVKNL